MLVEIVLKVDMLDVPDTNKYKRILTRFPFQQKKNERRHSCFVFCFRFLVFGSNNEMDEREIKKQQQQQQ